MKIRKPRLTLGRRGPRITGGGISIGSKGSHLNISRRGVSSTTKIGPFSVNSRRGCSVPLGILLAAVAGLLAVTHVASAATPTATPTATATVTATATRTHPPEPTRKPTRTPRPTATKRPTRTPLPTRTATRTRDPNAPTATRVRITYTPGPTRTPIPPTDVPAQVQPTAVPVLDTPTPAPAVSVGRIGATCNDGTSSGATGSGACSHHGGVQCWRMSDGTCIPK